MEQEEIVRRRPRFSTTQIIAIGFLIMISIGALLLMLPVSSSDGQFTPFVDALFTSTTSSCVTGLVTVNTLEHWSLFGHIVILILIQFGGLGVVTFTTVFLIVLGRRITIRQRMVIQDAYNLDTLKGLVKLTLRIIKSTFIVEGIGALLYMIKFIPEFGLIKGIWKSVFTSISAFCNAGIDILGTSSLEPYKGSFIVNFTTMGLIVVGGIGFVVWWDIIRVIKMAKQDKLRPAEMFKKLSLHSKLVLSITSILIIGGALFIFIADFSHNSSLGGLPLHEKLYCALFQSVTVRTAGFQTLPQEGFTNASQLISMLLMFIGGSPGGTAGGVKTVTIGMIFLSVKAIVKGRKNTEVFGRKIAHETVLKGLSVVAISASMLIVSTMALSLAMNGSPLLDIAYETTSAIATVGLSRNFTASLTTIGKLIITLTMYAGRIGPITLALAFNINSRRKGQNRQLPEEKIMVG